MPSFIGSTFGDAWCFMDGATSVLLASLGNRYLSSAMM